MREWLPFSRSTRLVLGLLVLCAAGWHIHLWIDRRSEPVILSDEFASRDPEMVVLVTLPFGALLNEARPQAIMPVEGAEGWLTRDGLVGKPPMPVVLIGEGLDHSGEGQLAGQVVRLPEPRNFGQAISAMRRLARTRDCALAIEDPDASLIGESAPQIPILQIVWTRAQPGEEPRRCRLP